MMLSYYLYRSDYLLEWGSIQAKSFEPYNTDEDICFDIYVGF